MLIPNVYTVVVVLHSSFSSHWIKEFIDDPFENSLKCYAEKPHSVVWIKIIKTQSVQLVWI